MLKLLRDQLVTTSINIVALFSYRQFMLLVRFYISLFAGAHACCWKGPFQGC